MKTTRFFAASLAAMAGMLLYAPAQAQAQSTNLLATLTMTFDRAQDLSTPVLPLGRSYFFQVTGRYGVASANRGESMHDAAFYAAAPSTLDQAHNPRCAWLWNGTSTNRPSPDVYQSNHVYRFYFVGRGTAEVLSFTDSVYSDNAGTLTFDLYETTLAPFTSGLVAYYPFNGNANDAVGANDGMVHGATLTYDRFGQPNAAYHFDGFSKITASDQGLPLGNASRTFSLWVLCQAVATNRAYAIPLLYGTHAPGQGNWINVFTGNDGTGRRRRSVLYDFYNSGLLSTNLTGLNSWQHLVCLLESPATAKIFINGKLAGAGSVSANTVLSGALTLGGVADTAVIGNIDDVRIYDRALTANEVQQLYTFESQTHVAGQYQIVAGGFTWWEAKADAELRGGHLATFPTQAKWNALVNQFYSRVIIDAWIGGYQPKGSPEPAGNWTWVTGEPWNFSAWWPGEPNNQNPDDYLVVCWGSDVGWNNARWNDTYSDGNPDWGGPLSYILEVGGRVDLVKAVKPALTGLTVGMTYQLQVSGDMITWSNHGDPFMATDSNMIYPQYWDVDDWGKLFFRLQECP